MTIDRQATACPRNDPIVDARSVSPAFVLVLLTITMLGLWVRLPFEKAGQREGIAVAAVLAQDEAPAWAPPCGLRIEREVVPRAVAAGGEVTVNLRWRYDCRPEARQATDLLLLLDVSAGLNDASGKLLPQLQEGLRRLISRLPREGSRLGLVEYDTRVRGELPLAEGQAAIDQRLDVIRDLRNTGSGFSDALVPLARAEALLARSEAPAAVLLVDVGGSLPPNRDRTAILAACQRLRDAGVRVGVLSLPGANERYVGCASPGGALIDNTAEVRRVPELLGALASAWIGDPDLLLSEWHEPQDAASWTYVLGSGRPRGPDALRGAERIWQEYALAGAGDHSLSWALQAANVSQAQTRPLTTGDGAFLALVDRAGHAETWPVPRQEVCIYPEGRLEDCQPYLVGLTATAAAPTPRASTTPTRVVLPPTATRTPTRAPSTPPTATRTPQATPTRSDTATPGTPSSPRWRLWMPMGLK
jgi:hypothetical protein